MVARFFTSYCSSSNVETIKSTISLPSNPFLVRVAVYSSTIGATAFFQRAASLLSRPNIVLPCLLLVGESAGEYARVKECVASLPNGIFVSFPGLDHVDAFFRSDLVVPHIIKFLAQVGEG